MWRTKLTSTTLFIDAVYWQIKEWSEIETIRWNDILLKDDRDVLSILEPTEPPMVIQLKVEN